MVTMFVSLHMARPVPGKLTPWYLPFSLPLCSFKVLDGLNFYTSFFRVQSGPKDLTEQSQGVNYRSLGDLFYLAEQRKDTFCYDVAVQMIEIYNEQVRDLLVSDGLNKRYPFLNVGHSLIHNILFDNFFDFLRLLEWLQYSVCSFFLTHFYIRNP